MCSSGHPSLCHAHFYGLGCVQTLLTCDCLQHCRTLRGGRDLWGSSGPMPQVRQGQQCAQDHVQSGFNISQDGHSTACLPGWPVPLLSHSGSEKTSDAYMESPVCHFVPIASPAVTGHHWEQSGSISFSPPVRYLWCLALLYCWISFTRLHIREQGIVVCWQSLALWHRFHFMAVRCLNVWGFHSINLHL